MSHYNLEIKLSDCNSHEDVVQFLSPLFDVIKGDTVYVTIDINCFIYPDYLLLITSALKKLEEIGVQPQGNILYNNNTGGYASRMNFFQNLNANFNEQFPRQNPHNRFVEITNFDSYNDHLVADKVIDMLRIHGGIELSVLQGVSFCIGEVIGNIYFHAESQNGGWVVAQYYPKINLIRLLVCDTGVGIHASLTKNEKYFNLSERECLENSVLNGVTSGCGMGFGLYSTSNFVEKNGGKLLLYSGSHCLELNSEGKIIKDCYNWQGTFLYWEIKTSSPVDPGSFTNGYTMYVSDYEEKYGGTDFDVENLW